MLGRQVDPLGARFRLLRSELLRPLQYAPLGFRERDLSCVAVDVHGFLRVKMDELKSCGAE